MSSELERTNELFWMSCIQFAFFWILFLSEFHFFELLSSLHPLLRFTKTRSKLQTCMVFELSATSKLGQTSYFTRAQVFHIVFRAPCYQTAIVA